MGFNNLFIIDEKLEKAIDNTDMHPLRKSLYKKILDVIDNTIQVSVLAMEVMPGFVRKEDIRKIKSEFRALEVDCVW